MSESMKQQLRDEALVTLIFILVAILVWLGGKISHPEVEVTTTEIPAAVNATGPTVPLNQFKNPDGSWTAYEGKG